MAITFAPSAANSCGEKMTPEQARARYDKALTYKLFCALAMRNKSAPVTTMGSDRFLQHEPHIEHSNSNVSLGLSSFSRYLCKSFKEALIYYGLSFFLVQCKF